MRAIVLALAAAVLAGNPGCDRLRNDPPPVREASPHPELDPAAIGSVVRVDMGGRFRGSGVAVGPRHVVTALSNLAEYEFHRRRATVGADRVPAAVIAVDERRGLALIRSERPLARHARVADGEPLPDRAPVTVVGHADVESDPPTVQMRVLPGTVDNPHFSGESAGPLDLRDAMTVFVPDASDLQRRGTAVFDPSTGRLIGIVIGSMSNNPRMTAPLIAMPAPTLRAFLRANGVPAP